MSSSKQNKFPRVLVVDDEADLRELLQITLISMGFDVDLAPTVAEAKRLLAQNSYALCLTDMRLPDGTGIELVEQINRVAEPIPVAVITAYGSAETAVAALKAGAFDYLSKPIALDNLRTLVRAAVQVDNPVATVEAEVAVPSHDARNSIQNHSSIQMIGESAAMRDVKAQAAKLGRSMAPVAISGESGTGKELAARLVHSLGSRALQPFIAVNCGAIPEMLMEAEFFGYRKGAFTGANEDRDGFFAAANGGTLFLDEVADLPLPMQVKLLRAIQEKKVRKVGAPSEEPVDVRIISATHQDLAQCVAAGRFRQDLYYRLNVIELNLPALRNRIGDLGALCESILARLALRAGMGSVPVLATVTLKYLQTYHFPGNVRELENMLERALAFSNGEVIYVEDLGLRPTIANDIENERAELALVEEIVSNGLTKNATKSTDRTESNESIELAGSTEPTTSTGIAVSAAGVSPVDGVTNSLPDYLDVLEREMIVRALEANGQNRTAAARRLGITFRALRYRMQRLDMQ
jgi:two-component system, NtrC family, response regulator PilR